MSGRGILAMFAVGAILVAAACTQDTPPDPAQLFEQALDLAPTALDSAKIRYWWFANRFDRERARLTDSLGAPQSIVIESGESPSDSTRQDSVVTVQYPGLALYFFKGRIREFIIAVAVTAPRNDMLFGVGVGSRKIDVLNRFGRTDETRFESDSMILSYDVHMDAVTQNQFEFTIVRDTVRRVSWAFSVD